MNKQKFTYEFCWQLINKWLTGINLNITQNRNKLYIYIYIYIYIYVYLGSISSLMQISLNIIDILCLHIFFWIRSNSRITFIVFWGNWFMYHINQFPHNTIKVIREFERIQKKICRHKMSIMFNEIYIYIYGGVYTSL